MSVFGDIMYVQLQMGANDINSTVYDYVADNTKNGVSAEYEYDDSGNLIKVTYPDHDGEPVFEKYAYNSRNQLTMHTNVRGTVTVYSYDENDTI